MRVHSLHKICSLACMAVLSFGLQLKVYATAWTTATPGSITTFSNWTDGSAGVPTSFTTPGDTWTVTMAMTIPAFSSWTVGTASMTPAVVNITSTGAITCGSGGASPLLTIYGNFNITGGSYAVSGGSAVPVIDIYGNVDISSGDITVNGGAAILTMNTHGNFNMTGGNISVFGGGCNNRLNMYGNAHFSGTAAVVSSGGSAIGSVHFSLPSASGTMLIGNTSTGTWSTMTVQVDTGCSAKLDSNFSTTTGGTGFYVYGVLDCPQGLVINGTSNFRLGSTGTLMSGHTTGINGAIVNSGTKIFHDAASYGFNGTAAQVTGSYMPAALYTPSKIIINDTAGVTLSQTTTTSGTLAFTDGVLHTGAYTITTPGDPTSVTGAMATAYVEGILIKPVTGFTIVNYEVGDTSYTPMELTLSAAGTGGSISVKATHGLHPNAATSGFSTSNMVTHYWTIGTLSTAGPVTLIPKGTYNLSDITGGSNSYFSTQKYTGSAWLGSSLASTNTSSPYTTTPNTGIALTSLAGDYIFGRVAATLNTGTVTGASALSIYPNPSGGTFTLNLATAEQCEAKVVITNVTGAIVQEFTTTTNKPTEVLMAPVGGLYFVSATTNDGRYTGKLIIQ